MNKKIVFALVVLFLVVGFALTVVLYGVLEPTDLDRGEAVYAALYLAFYFAVVVFGNAAAIVYIVQLVRGRTRPSAHSFCSLLLVLRRLFALPGLTHLERGTCSSLWLISYSTAL